jgi:hypothetical protein
MSDKAETIYIFKKNSSREIQITSSSTKEQCNRQKRREGLYKLTNLEWMD